MKSNTIKTLLTIVGLGVSIGTFASGKTVKITNEEGVAASPTTNITAGTTVTLTITPPRGKRLLSVSDIKVTNVAGIGDIRAPRHAPEYPGFVADPVASIIDGESYGTDGAGDYQFVMGEHDVKVTVNFADYPLMEDADISIAGTYIYNKNIQIPADNDITVSYKENILTLNDDYTISYVTESTDTHFTDYITAGSHYVVITGINKYQGVQYKAYTIQKAPATIEFSTNYISKKDTSSVFTNPCNNTGDGEITYSSNDEDIATINEKTGEVTIIDIGDIIITATVTDGTNYTYPKDTVQYCLHITPHQRYIEIGGEPYITGTTDDIKQRYIVLNEDENTVCFYELTASTTDQLQIKIPATFEDNNETYIVTSISKSAFKNRDFITSIILPETDNPLDIGTGAFQNVTATIHVPLIFLDDYALHHELTTLYQAQKIQAEIEPTTTLWTFSSGIDIILPQYLKAYLIKMNDAASVSMIELTEEDFTTDSIIPANNGILMKGTPNTKYVITARYNPNITFVDTNKNALSFGSDNLLEPVVESKHFASNDDYYILYNGTFHAIDNDGTSVPASKAVLKLPAAANKKNISIVNGTVTSIHQLDFNKKDENTTIYDLQGRRFDNNWQISVTHPQLPKCIYIMNGKKIIK